MADGVLSSRTIADANKYRERFGSAAPYRHVVVDDFFDELFARELQKQFPSFDKQYALDEAGDVRGQAAPRSLRDAGPAYKTLDLFFASSAFRRWISSVTRVELDDAHDAVTAQLEEAFQGQQLLPYVGFNFHPKTHKVRRLKVMIFVAEWEADWGGVVRLLSDPLHADSNLTASYSPSFNRCLVLEAGPQCWQGFYPITLPAESANASNKIISVSLYNTQRCDDPALMYAPVTVPSEIVPEQMLTVADVERVQALVRERNDLVELREQMLARQAGNVLEVLIPEHQVADIPVLGYVRLVEKTRGLYRDGWATKAVRFAIEAVRNVTGFTLNGYVHQSMAPHTLITVHVSKECIIEQELEPGTWFSVWCNYEIPAASTAALSFCCSNSVVPADFEVSRDFRSLTIFSPSVTFEHVPPASIDRSP